jgi:hypothetical protein
MSDQQQEWLTKFDKSPGRFCHTLTAVGNKAYSIGGFELMRQATATNAEKPILVSELDTGMIASDKALLYVIV